jgi:hypothetical protein
MPPDDADAGVVTGGVDAQNGGRAVHSVNLALKIML